MNAITIGKETIRVTKEKAYSFDGTTVQLPDRDYTAVRVISPEEGEKLLQTDLAPYRRSSMCRILVTNEGSFGAAARYTKPLVMNFANAHCPGGGFLLGASAQEEALCRCSTLYASLTSDAAGEMYRYNNTHISSVESDYMLISENVAVFRDGDCAFLPQPFDVGVVTVPAPNRRGAALFASAKKIEETFLRRIRILLRLAAVSGYRQLVLGAWGCGAFGNNPEKVSGYFKTALEEEQVGFCFDEVCFAVYGSETGRNITAFRRTFTE